MMKPRAPMPASLRERFYFYGWQQTPMSREKLMSVGRKRARRFSLRVKIIILVVVAMVTVGAACTAISSLHFRDAAVDEQKELA